MTSDIRLGAAPPRGGTRAAIRWICTNNPFYVISAGLFLVGLWISFADHGAEIQPESTWSLMGWLAGYTLLLAGTALLLVRFAKVWDDARTVLLLVVLMFLATSVTFDEVLVQTPSRGLACYLMGLGFAGLVSEALLRGIGLALPMLFRVPYYLILALFFLYPLALTPAARDNHNEWHQWSIFGFTAVAGLIFLTLLPAARRGAELLRDNGSPWPWPLYPWTLFGMLALAVPARSYLLCYSMHLPEGGGGGQVIFGPYFLVPFGMAIAVILLELGLEARSRGVLLAALVLPVGLAILASTGHRDEPVYQEFLQRFTDRLGGTPLYLTLYASAAFYAYAALRSVPLATEALTAALAVLAFCSPASLHLFPLVEAQPVPLLPVAAVLLAIGIWRRDVRLCVEGCLLTALWLPTAGGQGYRLLRQRALGLDYIVGSLAAFGVAVLVSLAKSGLLSRRRRPPHQEVPVTPD